MTRGAPLPRRPVGLAGSVTLADERGPLLSLAIMHGLLTRRCYRSFSAPCDLARDLVGNAMNQAVAEDLAA
jgi:hypothetical protein